MDLLDSIERLRFLGREFLVWLWFETELFEGFFESPTFGTYELWLESQITLVQDKEQSVLKGQSPSATPEAREALRRAKLPTTAKIRLTRGEMEYAFGFAADSLALSSVKIPAQLKEEKHEQFYERMYLLEELEALMESLYADFLRLRVSAEWEGFVLPAIRDWAHNRPTMDGEAYKRRRREVLGRKERTGSEMRKAPAGKRPPPAPALSA